jgi:multiple sugar transport system substrate-binding protein
MTRTRTALAVGLAAVGLSACGGGGGGGTTAESEEGATKGAKKAPTLQESQGAKGEVTFCSGQDSSGAYTDTVKRFNREYRAKGLTAKLVEFPASADEQRQQAIQRLQAKSAECDVYQADVIWIAEFASQKWLMDLSDYVESRKDEFIPSTIESQRYDGKYWGLMMQTGAGLLYRDEDAAPEAPTSWQDLYAKAKTEGKYAYQGAAYEGLTVNFLEVAFAAGGKVLSDDGTKAELDSPENVKALQFMVDGIKDGAVQKATTTYMEEPTRQAFERGDANFIRNWSYVYAISNKSKRLKGKVQVTPLPPFEGGGKAGVLGGNGPVLSAYTDNAKAGVLLIDFLTNPESEARNMTKFSLPATVRSAYQDAGVKRAVPYSAELEQAIEQAKPRPVSPVYPQITQAIYKNVNQALSGEVTPEAALKTADQEVEKALSAF